MNALGEKRGGGRLVCLGYKRNGDSEGTWMKVRTTWVQGRRSHPRLNPLSHPEPGNYHPRHCGSALKAVCVPGGAGRLATERHCRCLGRDPKRGQRTAWLGPVEGPGPWGALCPSGQAPGRCQAAEWQSCRLEVSEPPPRARSAGQASAPPPTRGNSTLGASPGQVQLNRRAEKSPESC